MFNRTSLIAACGALLGLALTAATVSATVNRLQYLTSGYEFIYATRR